MRVAPAAFKRRLVRLVEAGINQFDSVLTLLAERFVSLLC
jgi:hypothetical protein